MKQLIALISMTVACLPTFLAAGEGATAEQATAGVFTTRPAPKQELVPLPKGDDVFHFVIFGDRTGGPAEGIRVLEQAVADTNLLDPDLVMTVGDLINGYNERPQWMEQMNEYRGVMSRLDMPWFPVAGNHDIYWRGPNRPENEHEGDYEMHFGPLWYAFKHKNAGFIAFYSDEGDPETGEKAFQKPSAQNVSDEQFAFLEQALEKLKECDHVFLFLHHPRWLGGNYEGSNWDKVHQLLVKAGNVSAVFGGHIHRMTYAGKQDGIEYFTLAAVGASLRQHLPQAGFLHHINVVTVRKGDIHVATIPVGQILDPREFTPEYVAEIEALVQGAISRQSAPIALEGGTASTRGVYAVKFDNPSEQPVEVTILAEELGPNWRMVPDHFHFKVEPKKSRIAAFRYRGDAGFRANDFSAPHLNVQTTYLGKTGRLELPSRNIPIDVILKDGSAEDQPAEDHALALSGDGGLRIESDALELPDGPVTVEAWVNPNAILGNQSLVSKAQQSEFGLALRGGMPSFIIHLDGKYQSAAATSPLKVGAWTHLAGVFTGQEVILYVDGKEVARQPASGKRGLNPLPLYVGADPGKDGEVTRPFDGFLDNVRVSSSARYTENFSPAKEFPVDEKTVLSYDFNFALGPFAVDRTDRRVPAKKVGTAKLLPAELTLAP